MQLHYANLLRPGDNVMVIYGLKKKRMKFLGLGLHFVGRTLCNGMRPGTYHDTTQGYFQICSGEQKIISCSLSQIATPLEKLAKKFTSKQLGAMQKPEQYVYQGGLPVVRYWEGDRIKVQGERKAFMVKHITYATPIDPYTYYRCAHKLKDYNTKTFRDDVVSILKRGNVWSLYNEKDLDFKEPFEEDDFFDYIGHHTEVPLPSGNWSPEVMCVALQQAEIDYIPTPSGLFTPRPIKYSCKHLGEKVRRHSLKQLGLEPLIPLELKPLTPS